MEDHHNTEHSPLLTSNRDEAGTAVTDESGKSGFGDAGVTMRFSNITCSVKERYSTYRDCMTFQNRKIKRILNDISGSARPGRLMAVMGPSGSGKTSFLDVLAGRQHSGTISGELTINNISAHVLFSRVAAYCTQEDILFPTLTVRETLGYAAMLRLPDLTKEQKMERVEEMLDLLRMRDVADSRVGGALQRGISGGEKRRVSVGLDLITQPQLLLCDEVTSGLDSHSAICVMQVLKSMTHRGHTVICTIHQPSSQLYELFDDLLLLAKGRVVYQGAADSAVHYFSSLGYDCPQGYSASDFMLELVADNEKAASLADSYTAANRSYYVKEQFSFPPASPEKVEPTSLGNAIPAPAAENKPPSKQKSVNGGEKMTVSATLQAMGHEKGGLWRWFATGGTYNTNWFQQVFTLMDRNVKRIFRDPLVAGMLFVSYLFVGGIISLMFSKLAHDNQNASNYMQQMTLCLGFMLDVFGIMAFFGIAIYLRNGDVFQREHASNYYCTSSYFVANYITNLPVNLIAVSIYSSVIFGVLRIADGDWSQFPKFLLINFLTMDIFIGLNEVWGALFRTFETASIVAGIVMMTGMQFNGVFINFPNIPSYLQWLYWSSFLTYSVTAVMLLQFSGYTAGQEWLDLFGLQVQNEYTCIYILLAFDVVSRTCTYLALRFMPNHRR